MREGQMRVPLPVRRAVTADRGFRHLGGDEPPQPGRGWGLAPKSDNGMMCWLEIKQISAAPALRRLGRAGLEAPPLRGQKILSFLETLERHFPMEIVSHMWPHMHTLTLT